MPRAGLDREAVTAIAVALVEPERDGMERLTLAAVAAEAGVAVPSLYKHVASLVDLRRSVAGVAAEELGRRMRDATVGRSGEAALVALAESIRAFAHQHPGTYAASQVAADPADERLRSAQLAGLEVVEAALRGFDLPEERQVDAIRAVRSAVHGFVGLEAAGGFGMPDDVDRSFAALLRMLASGLRALAQG